MIPFFGWKSLSISVILQVTTDKSLWVNFLILLFCNIPPIPNQIFFLYYIEHFNSLPLTFERTASYKSTYFVDVVPIRVYVGDNSGC